MVPHRHRPAAIGHRAAAAALVLLVAVVLLALAAPAALAAGPDSPYYFANGIGGPGTSQGTFGSGSNPGPHGIALDAAGNLFAVDMANAVSVQKFSPTGTFMAEFTTYGSDPGEVMSPYGIDVGADGTVYVLDTWRGPTATHRIQKYSSLDGVTYTPSGQIATPEIPDGKAFFIAVDDTGAMYVGVNDTGVAHVLKYGADGTLITTIGSWGSGDNHFYYVRGLAVSGDGSTLYVCDNASSRLKVFTRNPDQSYSQTATWAGYLDIPSFRVTDVALDADGYLYALDSDLAMVAKLSSSLVVLTTWGSVGNGDNQFLWPWGVEVGPDGSVFVSDAGSGGGLPGDSYPGNHRVSRFAHDLTPPSTSAAVTPAPNAAGWIKAAAATVALTAADPVVADEGHSGVAATEYSLDGGVTWLPGVSIPVNAQGVSVVRFRSTDAAGNQESAKSVTVRLDNIKPVARALYDTTVLRYRTASFRCRVNDARATAKVTIKIRKPGSTWSKSLSLGSRTTNRNLTYGWRCGLARGTYTWKVYATDAAGNLGVSTAKRLYVR